MFLFTVPKFIPASMHILLLPRTFITSFSSLFEKLQSENKNVSILLVERKNLNINICVDEKNYKCECQLFFTGKIGVNIITDSYTVCLSIITILVDFLNTLGMKIIYDHVKHLSFVPPRHMGKIDYVDPRFCKFKYTNISDGVRNTLTRTIDEKYPCVYTIINTTDGCTPPIFYYSMNKMFPRQRCASRVVQRWFRRWKIRKILENWFVKDLGSIVAGYVC